MLLVNDIQFPILYVTTDQENWDNNDLLNYQLTTMENLLKRAKTENVELTLIYICGNSKAPWSVYLKYAIKLYNVRNLIQSSLKKTILYWTDEEDKKMFNLFLTFYKPSKPFIFVHTQEELNDALLE